MNFDEKVEAVRGSSSVENIQVAVRVRPLWKKEKRCDMEDFEVRTLKSPPSLCLGDKEHLYDHVFPEDTTQETIYEDCVTSWSSALRGEM
eukprot:m.112434 g.112434  ORF g.112434 m.112434 type:complete len:90 (+) comp12786_c2_seq5:50-319(+)